MGWLNFICALCLATSVHADEMETWIQSARPKVLSKLSKNISPSGTAPGVVIASPSKHAPNYYFHWVRDASLTMGSFYAEATEAHLRIDKYLLDFLNFSRRNQLSGALGGLAEPRFNVDGTLTGDDWPRPQDDGPALRAAFFIELANRWLAEGKEDLVREKLYNGKADCVIKPDLEFVSHHWQRTSFDLWEELHGHHFFTRIAQYRALKDGAVLAERLGDPMAGGWYKKQAQSLEPEILRHWDESLGYLVSTLDRDAGVDYKFSNLDTSVILGILHSTKDGEFLSVTDDRVLSTANTITEMFRSIYEVNKKALRGVAIGRYPEDRYDGLVGSMATTTGNPWFLTTAALAELHYKVRKSFQKRGKISVTSRNLSFFSSLGLDESLTAGQQIFSHQTVFAKILQRLLQKGDDFLFRFAIHGSPELSFTEQFNRNTGAMQGATDLTWSYASFLTAVQAR